MANVRLTEETETRLGALSELRNRTPHYLMKAAIERFLDTEETLEAEHDAVQKRWEKFEITGEAIDHADVQAWANNLGARRAKPAF